jgi:hypothetical protein
MKKILDIQVLTKKYQFLLKLGTNFSDITIL